MGTSIQPYIPPQHSYTHTGYNNYHYPPPRPPVKRSWWRGFLVASLIHWVLILLLLWAWTSYQESNTITHVKMCLVVDKDPVIHEVRLPFDCKPEPKPVLAPKPKPKPKPEPEPRPRPQVQTPSPVVNRAVTPPPAAPPPPPQEVPEAINRFLQSYLEKLRARIRTTRTYPPQSVEQREEGTALVGFTLFKDGKIRNVNIAGSSGYPLLDENAVESLKQVSPFDPIPNEIVKAYGQNSFSFEIPIEYRLSEVL